MSTTSTTMSPQFENAVASATDLLASISKHLPRIAQDAEDVYDDLDLHHMGSIALLTSCRGCHLVEIAEDAGDDDLDGVSVENILERMIAAHELLIDHLSGYARRDVIIFVHGVGELCYELRRYDQRH